MAKKAKKDKVEKNFIVGWSDCGGIEQLELDTYYQFATVDEAKTHIDKELSKGNYSAGLTYFVVQVAAKSKAPSAVSW